MNPEVLAAVARLNRDARAGVLVDREVVYELKYRLIRAASAEGQVTIARTSVLGRCRSRWHNFGHDDDCEYCCGAGTFSLGFAVVTIGDVRWHVPDHVEPGKSWAEGAPMVDAGDWRPGEREEKRAPLEVLADLVAAERALGIGGNYDLDLGLLGDTGHNHEAKYSPPFPAKYRIGRIHWQLTACFSCFDRPATNPMITHPIVAEWAKMHRDATTYEPPPAPPYRHRRWW